MARTPGLIVPSGYSSKEEFEQDLRQRSEDAGFTPFDASDFVDDVIEHVGILGMRWGHHKTDLPGVSRATNKDAEKDASEFARARAFYGEGAGTRRKLIKGTVEGKSKRDPNYKKAFDHHLSRQDSDKHVDKARSERKRTDIKNSTTKTARGISHMLRGNTQYASAAAAGLFVAAIAVHKTGIDKIILNAGKKAYRHISGKNATQAGMKASDFLKNMGMS